MLDTGEKRGILVRELGAVELAFQLTAAFAAPSELLLPAKANVGERLLDHEAELVLADAGLVLVLDEEGLELVRVLEALRDGVAVALVERAATEAEHAGATIVGEVVGEGGAAILPRHRHAADQPLSTLLGRLAPDVGPAVRLKGALEPDELESLLVDLGVGLERTALLTEGERGPAIHLAVLVGRDGCHERSRGVADARLQLLERNLAEPAELGLDIHRHPLSELELLGQLRDGRVGEHRAGGGEQRHRNHRARMGARPAPELAREGGTVLLEQLLDVRRRGRVHHGAEVLEGRRIGLHPIDLAKLPSHRAQGRGDRLAA